MDKILSFLTMIMDEKSISHRTFKPGQKVSSLPDLGLREMLYKNFDKHISGLNNFLAESKVNTAVYIIRDEFLCNYFICPQKGLKSFLIAGPYVTDIFGLSDVKKIIKRNSISEALTDQLVQYYSTLPVIQDSLLWEAVLKSFCDTYYGQDCYTMSVLSLQGNELTRPENDQKETSGKSKDIFEIIEKRYLQEKHTMDCISNGDREGALRHLKRASTYGMEKRSSSLIRDQKNYMIIFNTTCRLAAYKGGAHPYSIDQLSREFSIMIEKINNYRDLRALRDKMLTEYCKIVSEKETIYKNPLTSRITSYIQANFSSELRLGSTAKEFGISPNYLSALFKNETGLSFSEYVIGKRLTYSRDLLKETSYSISEIASLCGIPDANYFSRLFKKEFYVSPKQYRFSIHS